MREELNLVCSLLYSCHLVEARHVLICLNDPGDLYPDLGLKVLLEVEELMDNIIIKEKLEDSDSLLRGIYTREVKVYVHTKSCTWVLHCTLVTVVQNWKPFNVC